MAISRRRVTFPPPSSFSRLASSLHTLVSDVQRWTHSSSGEKYGTDSFFQTEEGSFDPSTWRTMDSRAAGISKLAISSPTWTILENLQRKGFKAYLVGGCVRDLLLRRTPKDFDVITNATLKQVKKQFKRCIIVGNQFPICHVHLQGSIIEVSSFSTVHKNRKNEESDIPPQMSNDDINDYARWKNCLTRDFTINSLFFDPVTSTIYDYVGGIEDLRSFKVRTVVPAHLSFEKDCARILRGLRIASRLGLQFSKDTATAIQNLSSSILTLNMQRLQLELNNMLAYGAAVSSICLLQKFKLLDILFPIQAAYLDDQIRKQVKQGSTMLMKLFSNADKLLAADRPANGLLWSALLAFHLALVENPQDSLVVWTYSAILYKGTWKGAIDLARQNERAHHVEFVPEICSSSLDRSHELILEEVSHLASLVKSSVNALISLDALQQSLSRYHDPSSSGVVFVSQHMGRDVSKLFDVMVSNIELYDCKRKKYEINYERLKKGNHDEVRFVLGKIIMETMMGSGTSRETSLNTQKIPGQLSALFR